MNRRSFLKTLSALPFVGGLFAVGCSVLPKKEVPPGVYLLSPSPHVEAHKEHLALHREVLKRHHLKQLIRDHERHAWLYSEEI